jgi:hypothetical protein
MESVWFFVLCVLVALPLTATLRRPALIFEYPFFMAFTFAAFILPQSISLMRFPGYVQDESVAAVLLMSVLCMAACLLGYRLAPSQLAIHLASRPMDLNKLFHAGVVFVVAGLIATSMMSTIEVQYAEVSGGLTGAATIVLFFRQLAYPGFAIVLFCALNRASVPTILMAIVGLYAPVSDVVIGRRENTALLFLTIVMAFYYERGLKPSRLALFAVLVFSMIAIPATGKYRAYVGTNRLDEIGNLDLLENFQRFLTEESTLELRNGAAVIEATRETENYELGKGYWNHLVFRYVPAQWIGEGFKQALMFSNGEREQTERTETGFRIARGSTVTGMGDAFKQFGWFGCLFFAFMAVLFKGMWQASLVSGALFARLMYVMTFTSGMRAVTHWTLDFIPGLVYFAIFLGLASVYAAVREQEARGPIAGRGRDALPGTARRRGTLTVFR